MSDKAIEAMTPYLKGVYGNPSSLHTIGQVAKEALEDARARMAKCLNCDAKEIYFTSGGSEADNQAIRSAALNGARKGKKHIVTTAFEHHAVLHTLKKLEKDGFEVTYLGVHPDGLIGALMKEMLDSTHESLSGIDHQLSLIFDRVSGNTISNQHEQLKSMIAMGLNEMYTAIVKANTGIPVSITEYSEAIVDYLITASSYTNEMTGEPLIKTIAANMSKALGANTDIDEHRRRFEYGDNYSGMLFSLMKWMRDIDYSTIAIGENIALDVTLDGVEGEVAKIFIKEINSDFYLNTFFHIFFSLERGNDEQDFTDYIRYYADTVMADKTQEQIYRTLARLSELPAYKLPLTETIKTLAQIK